MKRSYSEVKDDVTICLKYPLLRKWTRELSFQPVQMIENTRLDAWLALSRPAQASCIMYLISSFRICACMCAVTSVMSNSLRPLGLQPTTFLCPWDTPGKNTGVGYHAFFQGIFPTQGSNPNLSVSCFGKWVLYHQCHLES